MRTLSSFQYLQPLRNCYFRIFIGVCKCRNKNGRRILSIIPPIRSLFVCPRGPVRPSSVSKALVCIPQLIHIISLSFLLTNIQRTPTITRRPPTSLTVHPVALFSILDHYLRRQDSQERVIGTLLGTRSENGDLIDVKTAFAVLHSETSEQVAVDMDYHHQMYELCQRVSPKEVIVGW